MKKICVVSSNRADFDLLHCLLSKLKHHSAFRLQIMVVGGHFSAQQNYSWKKFGENGFKIDYKIEIFRDCDSGEAVGREMGEILSGAASGLAILNPDLLVVLGDRFEILAVAAAATVQNILIAHLHGGELSLGAIDDSFRHAVSKLSHLHFVANEDYRQRVIQLGEPPGKVFNVGGFENDSLSTTILLEKGALYKFLGIPPNKIFIIVTWHPETHSRTRTLTHFQIILSVLDEFEDLYIVFTRPNNDPGNNLVNTAIDEYITLHTNQSCVFDSLGSVRYLSALKYAAAVLGNSSSGLSEAPILNTWTINIGDRQAGRVRYASIVDCKVDPAPIKDAINRSLTSSTPRISIETDIDKLCSPSTKMLAAIEIFFTQDDLSTAKLFHNIKVVTTNN